MPTTKKVEDSRMDLVLPFGTDLELREANINYFGDLQFGKLLERLDTMAGTIAYKHTDGFDLNLTIVTAACDRIDLYGPLRSDCDIRLRGQVNWVGRSSMEIGIRLESKVDGEYRNIARAYFIMVAIAGTKAAEVHQLQLETDEEKRRFQDGLARQEQRRSTAQKNYLQNAPTAEESQQLHQLFGQIRNREVDGILMSETFRQTTLAMQPQDRNIHHKIFGGYIMRQSFSLAWNIAYLFTRSHPLFVALEKMYFYKPVEIGAVVSFSGVVVYTGKTSYIVEVTAEVIDPKTGFSEVINVAYYIFVAVDKKKQPIQVPKILPHTYEEGLKYLEGARYYRHGKDVRQQREKLCEQKDFS